MPGDFNLFDTFVEDLGDGVHSLKAAGHTLKFYLTNNTPSASADAVLTDLAGITAENGYSVTDIQNDASQTSGVLTVTGTGFTYTATAGGFGPFRYGVVYNDTPTSPADPLICWTDYGSAQTVNEGETLIISFNNQGSGNPGTLFTVAIAA